MLEFMADPSPLTAVRLAAADHRVQPYPDHCFLEHLNKAADMLAAAPQLLEALQLARECIAYCRRVHPNAQSGDGIPVETIIDAALAAAQVRQP